MNESVKVWWSQELRERGGYDSNSPRGAVPQPGNQDQVQRSLQWPGRFKYKCVIVPMGHYWQGTWHVFSLTTARTHCKILSLKAALEWIGVRPHISQTFLTLLLPINPISVHTTVPNLHSPKALTSKHLGGMKRVHAGPWHKITRFIPVTINGKRSYYLTSFSCLRVQLPYSI